MTELIDSLEIKGFRGFSELSIPVFSKVNLITGKNNVGKSSLLEAIRILVTRGSLETISSILSYREEINPNTDSEQESASTDLGPYRSLFTGFPDLSPESIGFSFMATGNLEFSSLSMKAIWVTKKKDEERKGECLSERACLSDRERRFNRAEQHVDHDQRETVPILVRPRDDDDDDHDDSGTVSDRAERLSLTFATPMMDHRSSNPFVQTTRRLNPNILATPIWINERSSEFFDIRECRFPRRQMAMEVPRWK